MDQFKANMPLQIQYNNHYTILHKAIIGIDIFLVKIMFPSDIRSASPYETSRGGSIQEYSPSANWIIWC